LANLGASYTGGNQIRQIVREKPRFREKKKGSGCSRDGKSRSSRQKNENKVNPTSGRGGNVQRVFLNCSPLQIAGKKVGLLRRVDATKEKLVINWKRGSQWRD